MQKYTWGRKGKYSFDHNNGPSNDILYQNNVFRLKGKNKTRKC